MNNSSKSILLTAGATTLLIGAGLWWYKKNQSSTVSSFKMSDEEVIRILKRFKRDYYPVLKMIWTTVDKVVNSYKVRYGSVPESLKKNMNTIVMDENPQFHKLIQEMEDEVYTLFDITDREGFEKLSQELVNSNNEVKELMNSIKENIEKCCLGVQMDMGIPLPDYVSMEKTFNVYKSTAFEVQKSLKEFLVNYQNEHGTINPYDQEFNKQISDCLSPNSIKRALLKTKGYHNDEVYHEEYLFSASIKQFSKVNKPFENAIKKIDTLNQTLIELQLRPMANFDYIQTEIEKILLIEIEEPIVEVPESSEAVPVNEVKADVDQKEDDKAESKPQDDTVEVSNLKPQPVISEASNEEPQAKETLVTEEDSEEEVPITEAPVTTEASNEEPQAKETRVTEEDSEEEISVTDNNTKENPVAKENTQDVPVNDDNVEKSSDSKEALEEN